MELCVSLAQIEECTDPFEVGAELELSLHLHVIDLINTRDDSQTESLTQPANVAAIPDLTYLVARVQSVEADQSDAARSKLCVSNPLPIQLSFGSLQAGPWQIPTKIGDEVFALGNLQAISGGRIKARVLEVLSLDLNPQNPTFGSYLSVNRWREGQTDVSNLATLQTVYVKIEI
jgi:hypothetical protein